jgi:hypothetical protein
MKKNINKLDYFQIELKNEEIKVLLTIVIILVIILLFRKKFSNIIERIIVFTIIFLLFIIITKNLVVTFIGTSIIFLLVNLIIKYRNTIENFQDLTSLKDLAGLKDLASLKDLAGLKDLDGLKDLIGLKDLTDLKIHPDTISSEPSFDKNIFETDSFKKSSNGIQELLKKVNGGIELKDDDIKDSGILNIDLTKYSDDKKPNALKDAQKETYELINTVNALKDTISTLAPVLQEGKKLMNIFENLKL